MAVRTIADNGMQLLLLQIPKHDFARRTSTGHVRYVIYPYRIAITSFIASLEVMRGGGRREEEEEEKGEPDLKANEVTAPKDCRKTIKERSCFKLCITINPLSLPIPTTSTAGDCTTHVICPMPTPLDDDDNDEEDDDDGNDDLDSPMIRVKVVVSLSPPLEVMVAGDADGTKERRAGNV